MRRPLLYGGLRIDYLGFHTLLDQLQNFNWPIIMFQSRTVLLSSLCLVSTAFAGQPDLSKKMVVPAHEENPWVFLLAAPGWAAGVSGDVGVGKFISYASVSPKKVIQSYDMVVSLRGEVSKGRFGVMGDFMYLSLSDGVGTNTVVNKVDYRLDETIGQLALRWRLIENPKGSVDIYGGARYMSMYQQVTLQPNSERINEQSAALVDAAGEQLRTAISDSGLKARIEDFLRPIVSPLLGRDRKPTLPVPPLGSRLNGEIRDRVLGIVVARKDELIAAIQEKDAAATAALKAEAQKKIDAIKKDLTKRIANTLNEKIDRSVSSNLWWIDPFVGLRGRYNFNQTWYLTARGDVGGFGVGSKFAWQAEGALGCQLTRYVFTELGYRALGVDFQGDGITNNTITHGVQLTLGVVF